MCAVSYVGDDWTRRVIPNQFPWINPNPGTPINPPNNAELERLREEVKRLEKELKEAKKQDEEDGNPDCEMEDKIEVFRRIGRLVGIALEEIFDGSKTRRNK